MELVFINKSAFTCSTSISFLGPMLPLADFPGKDAGNSSSSKPAIKACGIELMVPQDAVAPPPTRGARSTLRQVVAAPQLRQGKRRRSGGGSDDDGGFGGDDQGRGSGGSWNNGGGGDYWSRWWGDSEESWRRDSGDVNIVYRVVCWLALTGCVHHVLLGVLAANADVATCDSSKLARCSSVFDLQKVDLARDGPLTS